MAESRARRRSDDGRGKVPEVVTSGTSGMGLWDVAAGNLVGPSVQDTGASAQASLLNGLVLRSTLVTL